MKWKLPIIIGIAIVLVLIGGYVMFGAEEKFEGEWVFSDGDEGCATDIKFTGDNMMTVYTSFGVDLTGTIEKVENDSYSFDPKMGVFMIELKKLDNGLLYMKDGNKNCHYQKK